MALLSTKPGLGFGMGAAKAPPGLEGTGKLENLELIIGDIVVLWCLCLYKQIAAIVVAPEFGGWLSPVEVNWVHISEYLGIALTVILTWTIASYFSGNYESSSTSGIPTTIRRTSAAWLLSQPAVLLNFTFVTHPMALQGPYEPVVTMACVLGVMVAWRCYYSVYLDLWNLGMDGNRDHRAFWQASSQIGMMSLAFLVALECSEVWQRGFLGWGFGS